MLRPGRISRPGDLWTSRNKRTGLFSGCRVRRLRGRVPAFTLLEMLVVMGVVSLLLAVLLPALARSREQSRRTVCGVRLKNLGIAAHTYMNEYNGKLWICRWREQQIALNPKLRDSGTGRSLAEREDEVDWQKAAASVYVRDENWECPNREGAFRFEQETQEWLIGYQYFGGIRTWHNKWGDFKSRSPEDESADPRWALAADTNLKVDGYWGGGPPTPYGSIPPHPKGDGSPDGGNELFMDASVKWVRFEKMEAIHSWDPRAREAYWWQGDLGEFGDRLRTVSLSPWE